MNVTPEEQEKARQIVGGLALADHLGDVNDYLPDLCRLLGLPEPEWDDDYEGYRMAWWEDEGESEFPITAHAWVGIAGHRDDPECSVCGESKYDHKERDE